jgi:UbiD family decarboxylase
VDPSGADLRGFLEQVRRARPADVLVVDREVDPRHETAAIVVKLEQRQRSPVIVFERVRGTSLAVVTNVCGAQGRLALALGCGLREIATRYAAGAEQPIAPVVVDDAPVHEVVVRGDAVDLGALPPLVYHAGDASEPYITAAIVAARDPEDGRINLSYHRLMITGRASTAIYMEKGRHLDGMFARYEAAGRAMPVAVFVGAHPAWSLGALYSGPLSEYDVIGGLAGAPLPVARCLTNDLVVPARAELVLEGEVAPGERVREGPFGEFTGWGTGTTQSPVLHVRALTHRAQPLYQDVVSGHLEHLMLSLPALELRALRDARAVVPAVTRVSLPAPLTLVVAMRKRDDAEPQRVLAALLHGDIYTKQVIVVDDDVDPTDLRAVLAAAALHAQADRSLVVARGRQGTPLDPSSAEDGTTAKWGLDATRPLAPLRAAVKNAIPQDVLDRVDLDALLGRK